jgi:trimethylamine---corrinoid protein Co-methyltransferase
MSGTPGGHVPAVEGEFSRLTAAQCERLHEATLRVLARTGLVMEEPEALDLMRKAGADVDGTRVRIGERLVDWALSVVPKSVILYDRAGEPAIRLEGRNTYFGPGSDCIYCWDHHTAMRRRAVLQDVVDTARVIEALPNYDFVMSLFTPSDVPQRVMDRHQMEAMLGNCAKPVIYVTLNDPQAHLDATAMAEVVAGGAGALEARPFLACYKNTLLPLQHNSEALRTLIDLSRRGLPCIYSPVSTAGTMTPMTVLGSLLVVHAGVLAGLVLSQLVREGAPFIAIGWAGESHHMRHLRDMFAQPDHRAIYAALLHWYGLPMWTLGGVTEAKLPDQQAAAEAALTIMADAVAGGHMIHDIGFMESSFCGSLTQLALCDDIIGWVKGFLAPVEITDEELALDVIDQVGPSGTYLAHKHTRRHARSRWEPQVFSRESWGSWNKTGCRDATARAVEVVDEILGAPVANPLPPDVAAAVHAVVEAAGRRASAAR